MVKKSYVSNFTPTIPKNRIVAKYIYIYKIFLDLIFPYYACNKIICFRVNNPKINHGNMINAQEVHTDTSPFGVHSLRN